MKSEYDVGNIAIISLWALHFGVGWGGVGLGGVGGGEKRTLCMLVILIKTMDAPLQNAVIG